ncbi:hypothetical protein ABMA28_012890 [Loxostege sticticalis]|uniref:Transferrin-like domain-containing protein n=1 Tax=Loxostege sticticalis TaxID=481309 RepID=A0ABD0S2W8_LOXSC
MTGSFSYVDDDGVKAQQCRVCVSRTETVRCQNLDISGSGVACEPVTTNVECAEKLLRGTADFGYFTEEELLLLAQQQPNEFRVVATRRDVSRQEQIYTFEAVAVVPSNHTNGLAGLRGGRYCHPGFDVNDNRWSPRVLRALELAAARTDRCEGEIGSRTSEEMEVTTLSNFFSAACRPGDWSANTELDADLKRRFPTLCSMCSANGVCAGYNTTNSINVAGVVNSNRHIQALDCLTTSGTVAFVAWQHVREFFTIRSPNLASSYSLLCEDGSLLPLTTDSLNSPVAPCSLVRQPWGAIVARNAVANTVSENLQAWYPTGTFSSGNVWQNNLWSLLSGGANARLVFEQNLQTPLEYTSPIRTIPSIDSTTSCLPAHRWCTVSPQEQNKCLWVRNAAHSLGIQPPISCQQRPNVFDCFDDIREARSDFFSVDSHYGYLARRHFNLSPVKLTTITRDAASRVATLIKASAADSITRFENLRDKVACFPEYGSIAYVAFVRIAQERGVISPSQCNYQRAVGEFFNSACAPGALHASHVISDLDDFNATTLCTACRPNFNFFNNTETNFTCAYDNTNLFLGNTGSLTCLNAAHTDVAVVELQNIDAQLRALGLTGNNFRALCANNSLAVNPGTNIDDNCLIAHVVDAEVLTRRNDPLFNSINSFLDAIDLQFGFNTAPSNQLINLHIYSPFNGDSDLLFKDSTRGVTNPTNTTDPIARNYIELFRHLESCTSSATTTAAPGVPGIPGIANRNIMSVMTLAVMGLLARFVVY